MPLRLRPSLPQVLPRPARLLSIMITTIASRSHPHRPAGGGRVGYHIHRLKFLFMSAIRSFPCAPHHRRPIQAPTQPNCEVLEGLGSSARNTTIEKPGRGRLVATAAQLRRASIRIRRIATSGRPDVDAVPAAVALASPPEAAASSRLPRMRGRECRSVEASLTIGWQHRIGVTTDIVDLQALRPRIAARHAGRWLSA